MKVCQIPQVGCNKLIKLQDIFVRLQFSGNLKVRYKQIPSYLLPTRSHVGHFGYLKISCLLASQQEEIAQEGVIFKRQKVFLKQ